jgi:hypothetical protein
VLHTAQHVVLLYNACSLQAYVSYKQPEALYFFVVSVVNVVMVVTASIAAAYTLLTVIILLTVIHMR